MTPTKRIGKYPVIREIGQGAMGKVFEGFDPDTGAKVAIKILRAEHLDDSKADSVGARFGREGQVGQQLRHPNIVAVHECGEQGRIRFIAMEFIEGRELRKLIRERGRFELRDALRVMRQLLAALDCSHQHGIVHRDIKPSNIMVMAPLHIKVMDFGIAHIDSAAFTQVGTVLGTTTYMSPEQMRGEPADVSADLWAAGIILFELLTGRVPFAAPRSLDLMRDAMQLAHPAVCQLVPGLPASLDVVLDRALAKKREDRYPSAMEFAQALAAVAAMARNRIDLEPADAPDTPDAGVDLDLDAAVDPDATIIRLRPPM